MALLYVLLLVLVVFFELLRRRDFIIDFLSVFNFFFSLYYIFVPIIFLFNSDDEWKYLSIYSEAATSIYLYFSIFISLVLVNSFYIMFNRQASWECVLRLGYNSYYLFVVSGLILGCLLINLQAIGYGGLIQFSMSGYLSRSGEMDGGIFDYVTPFVKVIIPFFFIFWSLYLNKLSFKNLIILSVSALFFVAWAMSTGGRGNLILSMLPVFFIYVNSRGLSARVFVVSGILTAIGLVVIMYGRSVFYALALSYGGVGDFYSLFTENQEKYSGQNNDTLVAIFRHFDHSLVSAFLILEDVGKYGGYRYIFDYPRVILDALPGLSVSRGDLDAINSSIPAQINKELIGLSGGYVPVGWVGLMLLNGGVIFLALAAAFSGFIGGKFSALASATNIPGRHGLYVFFAFFWFWLFFHSDPLNLVIPMFSYYIFILVFLFIVKFRKR